MSKNPKHDQYTNYNIEDRTDEVQETINYSDGLGKTSEINKEDNSDYTKQEMEYSSQNIHEENIHGREVNRIGVKPKVKKPSANVVPTILLAAATSGTVVVGTTAMITKAVFDVSLFSKDSNSLIFYVESTITHEEDRIIAELSYENSIVEEFEIPYQSYFVPFIDLLPDSEYNLRILYYENYYKLVDEVPIYSDDPPTIEHNAKYYTSLDTIDNCYFGIMEYSHEMLRFFVENNTNHPFVTIRATIDNKTIFVKDLSEPTMEYTIDDIPYGKTIILTAKYKDIGLGYFELEPLIDPGLLTNAYVYYDANGGEGSMDFSVGYLNEYLTLSKNTFTREDYTFIGWGLNPVSDPIYSDEETILLLEEETTLYAIWQPIVYSYIHYHPNGGDGDDIAQKVIRDGVATIMTNPYTRKNHTFQGWSETSDGGVDYYEEGNYQVDFDDLDLYAVWLETSFSINEISKEATYHSVLFELQMSNPDFQNQMSVFFDGEYVEPSDYKVASDGKFVISKDDLLPRTEYKVLIYGVDSEIIYQESISTETTVEATQVSKDTLSFHASDSFYDYALTNGSIWFGLYDDEEVDVITHDVDAQDIVIDSLVLYQGTYTFKVYKSDEVIDSYQISISGDVKPEFNASLVSSTITYNSLTLEYAMSDISKANDMKVYFDEELLIASTDYNVLGDGSFIITKENLEYESEHKVVIKDINETVIAEDTFETNPIINIEYIDQESFAITLDDGFNALSQQRQAAEGIGYIFTIYGSGDFILYEGEFGGNTSQTAYVLIAYEDDYRIVVSEFDYNLYETTPVFTKYTHMNGVERPTFDVSVDTASFIVTITYTGGVLPDASPFTVRFSSGSYEIDVDGADFSKIGDTHTFNLYDGGLDGNPGYLDETPVLGEYKYSLLAGDPTFFVGHFTIS